MRIFRGKNWLDMLLGEMVNLETGKLWFHLGKLVMLENGKKRSDYPSFDRPNRTITITAAEGIIMLPIKVANPRMFVNNLFVKLEQKYKEAGLDINTVLQGNRSIEDGNQHFVTTKISLNASGYTVVTEHNQTEEFTYTARRFEFIHSEGSGVAVVPALFIWRFLQPSEYYSLIDPRGYYDVGKQLLTILCDEGSTLNKVPELANGAVLTRNLTYSDFKFWNLLFSNTKMSPWGDITSVYNKLIDLNSRDRANWMHEFIRNYDQYVRIKPHPNFTVWHTSDSTPIQLSPDGIIYELHMRLGKGTGSKYSKVREKIDERAVRVPYPSLTLTCQDTDSEKIKAHLKKLNIDLPAAQVCQQCYMPLYGESYSIASPDGNIGICRVCVANFSGTSEIKIFTHPTKLDSMLKILPCQDADYLAILKAIGGKNMKPQPLAYVGISAIELENYVGMESSVFSHLFVAMWRYNIGKMVFPYFWNSTY